MYVCVRVCVHVCVCVPGEDVGIGVISATDEEENSAGELNCMLLEVATRMELELRLGLEEGVGLRLDEATEAAQTEEEIIYNNYKSFDQVTRHLLIASQYRGKPVLSLKPVLWQPCDQPNTAMATM